MSFADAIFGSKADEDALWAPDPAEEHDHALHARNCRKRWEVQLKMMREVQESTRQVRLYLFVIVVLLVINSSPQLANIVQTILHAWLGTK